MHVEGVPLVKPYDGRTSPQPHPGFQNILLLAIDLSAYKRITRFRLGWEIPAVFPDFNIWCGNTLRGLNRQQLCKMEERFACGSSQYERFFLSLFFSLARSQSLSLLEAIKRVQKHFIIYMTASILRSEWHMHAAPGVITLFVFSHDRRLDFCYYYYC